jgi:hypothetical protein
MGAISAALWRDDLSTPNYRDAAGSPRSGRSVRSAVRHSHLLMARVRGARHSGARHLAAGTVSTRDRETKKETLKEAVRHLARRVGGRGKIRFRKRVQTAHPRCRGDALAYTAPDFSAGAPNVGPRGPNPRGDPWLRHRYRSFHDRDRRGVDRAGDDRRGSAGAAPARSL